MKKPKQQKELIYLLARHSNWQPENIEAAFRKSGIYPSQRAWLSFLKTFLIGTGAAFMVAGIIFFFAYNWNNMHKFARLGILELMLLACCLFSLFSKIELKIKNITLSVCAMLVGVLFAVFGQIYQTGANAYDFFLNWTLCVALWVLVARYTPLWFIFMVLVNTTLILYQQQIAIFWSQSFLFDLFFLVNALPVVIWEYLVQKRMLSTGSRWLPKTLSLAALVFISSSICMNVFDNFSGDKGLSLLLVAIFFSLGILYGFRKKDLFYLLAIPFSIIVIISAFIIRISGDEPIAIFLLVSLFVILSTTQLIRKMMHMNKKWYGHN